MAKPESNWGHKDFQSSALPTELFRRITKDIENANFRDWVNGITSRRPKPCDQYSLIKCSDRGVRGREPIPAPNTRRRAGPPPVRFQVPASGWSPRIEDVPKPDRCSICRPIHELRREGKGSGKCNCRWRSPPR